MPKSVIEKLPDVVGVKAETGNVQRIDHEVDSLDHLDYSDMPNQLEPYQKRYLQQQKELRYSIITGLIMEIENINDRLEDK